MNTANKRKPTQQQFVLPLLDALENEGGKVCTRDLYDQVALKLGVSEEQRNESVVIGGKRFNAFERTVRWGQQRAKAMGLAAPVGKSTWVLTGKGSDALHAAAPGIVITIFTTDDGIALFGRAEEAIGHIQDESVQLLFTSPPYPILRPKQYGGTTSAAIWVEWFCRIAETWPKKMTANSSIVLNTGDAYEPGEPSMSLYQERLLIRLADDLGWKLCQRYAWNNASRLPSPAQWVTVTRQRVKTSLEQIYWLAPKEMPYADNRGVLVPYSDAMRSRLDAGGEKGKKRPSGHHLAAGAFSVDNGGAIPGNLLSFANSSSNDSYQKLCREQGLPVHPARFPAGIAEHFVKLTTKPGDLVFDPFSGSFTTGAVAESLGRKWIGSELMLDYALGGANRFPQATIHQPGLLNRNPVGDLLT
ncbi:DNA methyltransferase [Paraburkholderia sp. SIMBA_054]|uniref:DNA methyltransferase n=1 Tax=Paraburkholderia sp. SIMBA_054 TaxID=3085795 RepID=UPI00397C1BAA